MSDKQRELAEVRALFDTPVDPDATNSTPRPDELEKLLGHEPSSWRPIPLNGPVEDDAPPSILAIQGTSRFLLYPGSTNSISGESESGKSLLALAAAREVIDRGGRVLWLDYEDTRRRFISRLESMSFPQELRSSIDYLNPVHSIWNRRDNRATDAHVDFVRLLERGRYEFAVVDTMTGAMSVEGLDPNIGTEVEAIQRELMGRIVKETGAGVLTLDHVTKANEGRGRYAIGSERKLSGITGAAYAIEVTRPWSRALGGEPVYGTALLKITKDRPGYVRGGRSELSTVATIEVTADPDGGLRLRVVDPRDTVTNPPHELIVEVLRRVRLDGPVTANKVAESIEKKRATVLGVVDWLREKGALDSETQGRGRYLTVNEPRVRELDLE
jgi:DNA-binding transcriptional ArsR family regulator